MKKRIFLLPIVLLASLVVFNWGCGEEEDDEDLCQAFEEGIPESCEIPTICCPTDGASCYYVNPDGENYYCDTQYATDNDPDGCDPAINQYINDHCETTKMSSADKEDMQILLSKYTKQLMVEASRESVCF